jgi:CRP/FNR family transcriptional regulator
MALTHTVIEIPASRADCASCRLRNLCLTGGLDEEDTLALSRIVRRSRPLLPGAHLFRQGEAVTSLFIVMTGSVKNSVIESDGTEQIVDFVFPGELIGLEGLEAGVHMSAAVAMSSTTVCELPYSALQNLCNRKPAINASLTARLAKQLAREHRHLLGIGQRNVEARMVGFLLSLSSRMQMRGYSATEFILTMTRHEIANFLGMKTETVSRVLKRFQDRGLLTVDGKQIVLRQLDDLRSLASGRPAANDGIARAARPPTAVRARSRLGHPHPALWSGAKSARAAARLWDR